MSLYNKNERNNTVVQIIKKHENLKKKIKGTQKRLKNEYYRELADNINTVTEATILAKN